MMKRVLTVLLSVVLICSFIQTGFAEGEIQPAETPRNTETPQPQTTEESQPTETPMETPQPIEVLPTPTPEPADGSIFEPTAIPEPAPAGTDMQSAAEKGCYPITAGGHPTGLKPSSKEDEELTDKNVQTAEHVLPNSLGLMRINEASGGEAGLQKAAPGDGIYTAEDAASKPEAVFTGTLPKTVDNSTLKFFPMIGDQGDIGSCAAFATTYYLMTYYTAKARDWDVKSAGTSRIFSPKWSYNLANDGEDEGSAPEDIAYIMEKWGALMWDELPYDDNYLEWPDTADQWKSALKYRIDDFGFIEDINTPQGLLNLKNALNNGMIVVMGTDSFYGWTGTSIKDNIDSLVDDGEVGKWGACYMVESDEPSSHAITIVGYNDDIWLDRDKDNVKDANELGAFRVANSWGTAFEDNGFTWFSYAAISDTVETTGYNGIMQDNNVMYLVTDAEDYIPLVTAEVTMTTAHRGDIEYFYGVNWPQTSLPDTLSTFDWDDGYFKLADYDWFFSDWGGDYSIAGTADARAGTMLFDLSDIIKGKGIISPHDWSLEGGPLSFCIGLRDMEGGSTPVTLSGIVFENWKTGKRTSAAELGSPQSIEDDFLWYHGEDTLNSGVPAPADDPAVASLPQITEGAPVSAASTGTADIKEWRFTPSATGTYIFKTDSPYIYTEIQNSARNVLYHGDPFKTIQTFIRATLFAGKTYVLRTYLSDDANPDSSYSAQIYSIDTVSNAGLANVLYVCGDSSWTSLTPAFRSDVGDYSLTIPIDQGWVYIYPLPESERASITINGEIASYTNVSLNVGESQTKNIKVASKDGSKSRDYNITLKKSYEYTVTFDSRGGTTVAPIVVQYVPAEPIKSTIMTEPKPTKAGYEFIGWCDTPACDTDPVFFPYYVRVNTTLYAKWAIIDGDYSYWLSNGQATIYRYSGSTGALTLPSVLGGYSVAAIGTRAFENNLKLKYVTIPGNIKTIGKGAFFQCGLLAGVNMQDGVTSIGAGAFASCYFLRNVIMPDSLISIGESAFNACRMLKDIMIPASVTGIGQGAFQLCVGLQKAYFLGNAPTCLNTLAPIYNSQDMFSQCAQGFTIYYVNGKTGFTNPWQGYPTATFDPNNAFTVTFVQSNGKPDIKVNAACGALINPPADPTYREFVFTGWSIAFFNDAIVTFPFRVCNDTAFLATWKSATAYLDNISLSAGKLAARYFSTTTYRYTINLGENDNFITLTPIKNYEGASMTINGKAVSSITLPIASGKSAKITVKLTYGKDKKTYTFTIKRPKSTNNTLSSLSASAGTWSQPFDPNVTNYTLSLDENTKSVNITDAVASPFAKASFKSKKVTLNNGQSKKIILTVKAQSGARRTYTITVVRAASTNADLKSLKVSGKGCVLTPAFSAGQTSYNIVMPASAATASSVTISAAPTGYKAKVSVGGTGKTSKKVTLAAGQSVAVQVVVTAQSGAVKEYTVTVSRT